MSGSSSHILCECPTAGSIISFSGPPEKRKWENKDGMLQALMKQPLEFIIAFCHHKKLCFQIVAMAVSVAGAY
ncbi:MAG: hypothetical protein BBJ60_06830 [Desulfobacterales bacterium S7086C20]|nr:MAG: hypothetical protein BBJ60_06830 [Desulfobacterales bacterium S7086C20]